MTRLLLQHSTNKAVSMLPCSVFILWWGRQAGHCVCNYSTIRVRCGSADSSANHTSLWTARRLSMHLGTPAAMCTALFQHARQPLSSLHLYLLSYESRSMRHTASLHQPQAGGCSERMLAQLNLHALQKTKSAARAPQQRSEGCGKTKPQAPVRKAVLRASVPCAGHVQPCDCNQQPPSWQRMAL